jgi:hypothetical protein
VHNFSYFFLGFGTKFVHGSSSLCSAYQYAITCP